MIIFKRIEKIRTFVEMLKNLFMTKSAIILETEVFPLQRPLKTCTISF